MKRIELAKSVVGLAASGVAAAALVYAAAFVVWPPVKTREDYEARARREVRPPTELQPLYKRKDIEAVWTKGPQPPPPPVVKNELVATLVSVLDTGNPKTSSAVLQDAAGQHVLQTGHRLQGFPMRSLTATSATFDCGAQDKTLTIQPRLNPGENTPR